MTAPPTGPHLRAWRLAHGLTLQDMADRVGVRLGSVWAWEHGRKRPSRLAQARLRQVMKRHPQAEKKNAAP